MTRLTRLAGRQSPRTFSIRLGLFWILLFWTLCFDQLVDAQNVTTPVPALVNCKLAVFTLRLERFDVQRASFFWEGTLSTLCDADLQVRDVIRIFGVDSTIEGGITTLSASNLTVGDDVFSSSATLAATIDMTYENQFFPFDLIRAPLRLQARLDRKRLNLTFSDRESGIIDNFVPMSGLILLKPTKNVSRTGGSFTREVVILPSDFTWGPAHDADYDQLVFTYYLEREDKSDFVLLMLPTYFAFFISLVAMSMPVDEGFGTRFGILSGAVFAVVLNIQAVNNSIGIAVKFTLADAINFVTVFLIALAFLETLMEKWFIMVDERKAAKREKAAAEEAQRLLEEAPPVSGQSSKTIEVPAVVSSVAPAKKPKTCKEKMFPSFGKYKYHSMSLWTLVFMFFFFLIANLALLLGYRPSMDF